MSFTANRSVRLTLVAAAAFAAGTVHSAALASTGPVSSPNSILAASDFDDVLTESARLAAEGSLVHARSLLFQLRGTYGLELSDAQRDRAYLLAQQFESQLDAMNRFDVALETSRLGLTTDDLLTAETKARTVVNATSADGTQRHAAAVLLDNIAARRVELAPAAPLAIDRAVSAFDTGDFVTAKTEIERVVRLGVALDRTRAAQLKEYRGKLSSLELDRGSAFPAALTLMGPVQGEWLLASAETAQPTTTAGDPPASDPIEQVKIFTAKSLMGEAEQAFAERQLNTALTKYNRVLSDFSQYLSAEEIQLAESRRAQIQVDLGRDGGPQGGTVDQELGQRGLQRQQIEATYTNLMQQADAAMESADIRVARTRVAQARQTVQQGTGVLSEARYEDLITQIEAKISQINTREEEIRIADAEQRSITIDEQERLARADQMRDSDRKILEAIDRVRALQIERKYAEALQVVDLILFLDPNNPVGLLLKDVIRDSLLVQEYYDAKDERQFRIAEGFVENEKAMIPARDIIEFPEDWREISDTRIRGLGSGESEANRSTLAAVENTTVPVEFTDNPLSDVIGFIAQNAAIDVDVDWNSLEEIGIDQDMPVSLRLVSGAPISTVLDRVLAQVSDPALPAEWAVVDGILVIASDEVLRRNTTMRSYDIRDLLFEIPNFDNAPDFELQSSSGSGGGGTSPFQGGGGDEEDRVPRQDRVDQLVQVIQNNVDPNGWLDLGGNTGAVQELSGVLIITQTPKAHRQINGLLGMLRDVRAVQINVEARFLLVSQDFFEQIGFDLDVYFTDNNQFKLNQLIDPSIDGSDYFNSTDPNNVTGGGVFFVDLDGDGTLESTTITQPVLSPNTVGDQFSVVQASQNSFGLANGLAAGVSGFASDLISSNPALAVSGRFLDDIQVDFLVEATQADSRSVSLTAPRLTFTNGQRAWVAVTKDNAYISDLQPIVSDGSAAFDPTISIAQSGVVLDIEGVVSADRRYVTMTVITGISQLSFAPDVEVSAVAAGGGVGGGAASTITSAIQVPVTDQSTIRTSVTVPDQGTLLLGGQRVIKEVEVETGVPVLSKIPVLSRFFSNRVDVKEESTLIILIRPQILIQDEEEERNFPGLLDQLGLD